MPTICSNLMVVLPRSVFPSNFKSEVKKIDAGDHVVLLGEILNGVIQNGESMIFDRDEFS